MQSEKYFTIFKSIAKFFSVLGNVDRVRILALLLERPRDVKEIHELLNISQPRTSQSLKILKMHHIISEKKAGKHVYYSLKDEEVAETIDKVFKLKSIELSTEKGEESILRELTHLWHKKIQNENV